MESLDTQRIASALLYVLALVISVTVHEFGHAFTADRLGDRLPRSQGRVTLSPLAHADLFGTLLIPLFGAISGYGVLGWGKPVMTSLSARTLPRWISLRTADLVVSLAGPFMNVMLALLLSFVYVGLLHTGKDEIAFRVANIIAMNIGLCIFNLLPCPPLDGRSILFWLLGEDHPVSQFLQKFGVLLFFLLVMSPAIRIVMIPAQYITHFWLGHLQQLAPPI